MAPTLTLSIPSHHHHLPKSKAQETNLPKTDNILEKTCPSIPNSETKHLTFFRRKLLTSSGLGLVGGLGVLSARPNPANAEVIISPPSPIETASSRMSYTRFLKYLDEGAVSKVDLIENGQTAVVEIYNPALDKFQKLKVQLPGLPPELVRKMRDKNVNFSVNPPEIDMGIAIIDLLSNLAFPLILLGTLLLRNSRPVPGVGPNLLFGLGRLVIE